MRVEVGARAREHFVERLVEVGTQPLDGCALLFAVGREPLGVGRDPNVRLRHELLLTLCELGYARLRRLCGTIEILRPARETLLHLRLRSGEGLREGRGYLPFPIGELATMLFGDAALFLDEQRHGVGARTRQ